MALQISVLGSFQVSGNRNIQCKFESNKARALLAYLVIERNQPHSREQLTEMLWPENPPQSAFGNLVTLWHTSARSLAMPTRSHITCLSAVKACNLIP
jgi:DNA-binding SARP family transcriptional activator